MPALKLFTFFSKKSSTAGFVAKYYIAPTPAPTRVPTPAPTQFPTFAPPPSQAPLQPVGKGIVCGPEVIRSNRRERALEEKVEEAGSSNDRVTIKAPGRGLSTFWTPDTCYAACLPDLLPQTSFVINIYYDANDVQTCTCCRVCEGVRYTPRYGI